MTTSPARANLIGRIVSAVMETYFECKGSGWATPCAEAVDAILPHADPVAVASEAAEADGITLLRIYGDAVDGAWRTGATPDAIIAALAAKQAKNEARTWPDWRTQPPDAAITHVKCDEETRRQIRERAR